MSWIGARLERFEDERLLTGRGRYVADLGLPHMLHACFVRSPHPHAVIRRIDTEQARRAATIFTAADLPHSPLLDSVQMDGLAKTPQPALAAGRVRFEGEPVAIVLAGSRYLAEDAAELVAVEYEPLQPVMDAERADEAEPLHPELGTNVVYRRSFAWGDPDAAFADAAHVFRSRYHGNRFVAVPLETRGCLAEWSGGQLTVWSATQGPHLLRRRLASTTGIPEGHIRVIAPDVGGGFGQKIPAHPEDVAVALAARAAGRPVKWIEDRRENLTAAPHAKEQIVELELAVAEDGTFLALRARVLGDAGAYSFNAASALIEPYLSAQLMPGPYRIRHYACEIVAALTTKSPVAPYRGIGWTAGHTARELLIDRAARALGRDRADLRRQNLVEAREFPYASCNGMVFDSGSFRESLDKALELSGYHEPRGPFVGIGVSPYVEPTGWGSEGGFQSNWSFASYDAVRLSIEPSGEVTAAVGSPSQGQGHETTLAQVVAGELGVRPQDVSVIAGDTSATPVSTSGTRASRTAVVTGGGLLLAARDLREKLLRIAGLVLEAAADDLEIVDGEISVCGSPDRRVTVREVAERAYFDPGLRAVEPEPDLTAGRFHDPKATYSNGCVVCVVEVNPETGAVAVRKLVAVEDCGTIVNPLVVDGQIAGAVVQGVGGALFEGIRYGADGRLQTSSLLAYKLPKAADLPPVEIAHCVSPSPWTPGGIKGMGESGVIATPAAVACAVEDALASLGFEVERLPLTPEVLAVAR